MSTAKESLLPCVPERSAPHLVTRPRFYLGTHMPNWLEQTDVPLFVSRRRLVDRKTLPRPKGWWCLDSGGFTELNLYGEWRTSEAQYVADVLRFVREMGRLEWVAPMDWMCEPFVLAKTGMTVQQHQRRTIENFLRLRQTLGPLVIPVLQGWTLDDYLKCWELYHRVGVRDQPGDPAHGMRGQFMAVHEFGCSRRRKLRWLRRLWLRFRDRDLPESLRRAVRWDGLAAYLERVEGFYG